jgi:NTE family protein
MSIAIVLPGGGARGAYEAGALSVLLPALHARGEHIRVICGTSVGAINAALLGSIADLPAEEQAETIMERWGKLRKGDVLAPLVGPGLPLTALRFVGELLELPGVRLASVMDPGPLRASLERWIDWLGLHRNVKAGVVDAVCVVASALTRGGPVAFVESDRAVPPPRAEGGLRYVRTQLAGEHVRASAAIPLLFPPVEITSPRAAAGFYIDGGTRLNSPIAPALALGADKVIVIGFEPFAQPATPPVAPPPPRMADVAANILDGLLVDQVADDLHRLAAINTFFVEGSGAAGLSRSARAYRAAHGRQGYRRVSYALVAPARRGELGELAEEVFQERYTGWRGLLSPDYPLLSRILGGGRTRARGELLSFLLFDEHHIARLQQAGARDARTWLERHPRFWCSDAAHDLQLDTGDQANVREQVVLDEWRSLRRR